MKVVIVHSEKRKKKKKPTQRGHDDREKEVHPSIYPKVIILFSTKLMESAESKNKSYILLCR